MPFIQLSLESLEHLDDGRVAVAFQHELKRAVQDCIDRPIPDEIERVTDIALADIRERIASALEGVSVFFGSP